MFHVSHITATAVGRYVPLYHAEMVAFDNAQFSNHRFQKFRLIKPHCHWGYIQSSDPTYPRDCTVLNSNPPGSKGQHSAV